MKQWLARVLAAMMLISLLLVGADADEALRILKQTEGKKVTYTFVDQKGNPVNGPDGYAVVECEYNENARKTLAKIRYVDKDGNRKETAEGYSVIRFIYNGKGQIKEANFYGGQGSLKETAQGYAKVTFTYEDGTVSNVYYYDTKNQRTGKLRDDAAADGGQTAGKTGGKTFGRTVKAASGATAPKQEKNARNGPMTVEDLRRFSEENAGGAPQGSTEPFYGPDATSPPAGSGRETVLLGGSAASGGTRGFRIVKKTIITHTDENIPA